MIIETILRNKRRQHQEDVVREWLINNARPKRFDHWTEYETKEMAIELLDRLLILD